MSSQSTEPDEAVLHSERIELKSSPEFVRRRAKREIAFDVGVCLISLTAGISLLLTASDALKGLGVIILVSFLVSAYQTVRNLRVLSGFDEKARERLEIQADSLYLYDGKERKEIPLTKIKRILMPTIIVPKITIVLNSSLLGKYFWGRDSSVSFETRYLDRAELKVFVSRVLEEVKKRQSEPGAST